MWMRSCAYCLCLLQHLCLLAPPLLLVLAPLLLRDGCVLKCLQVHAHAGCVCYCLHRSFVCP